MIIQQAKDMRMGLIVNNKGQITDQAKFNEAMFALMDSKFKGGMEKQATTMKGLWSTVTGTTKNALAEIVGITADGTIKQGSLFENVKIAITGIATKLNEWSADGTIQKISEQVTEGVTNILNFIGEVITGITTFTSWIEDASDGAVIFGGVITGIATAVGLYTAAVEIHHGWTKLVAGAQFLWNAAMTANPIGLIVVAIAGLVAGLVYAYENSETFRMYVDAAWATIKEFGAEIMKLPEKIKQMWGNGIEKVQEFWGYLKGLWSSINDNPIANFALDILSLMNPITTIIRHFDKLKEGWNWIKDKVGLGDDKNTTTANTTTAKTTTAKTTTAKPVGSHRTGESFVKNDGMYKLHYGERVLTKAENSQYSQGGVSQSPSINISINAVQELGNEIKRAIQPIVETTIKNYQTKQLMKMGIAGGQ